MQLTELKINTFQSGFWKSSSFHMPVNDGHDLNEAVRNKNL